MAIAVKRLCAGQCVVIVVFLDVLGVLVVLMIMVYWCWYSSTTFGAGLCVVVVVVVGTRLRGSTLNT
jgi:hypothetical protein